MVTLSAIIVMATLLSSVLPNDGSVMVINPSIVTTITAEGTENTEKMADSVLYIPSVFRTVGRSLSVELTTYYAKRSRSKRIIQQLISHRLATGWRV